MTNYAALANLASGIIQAGGAFATNSSARSQAQIAEREAEERARLNDQDVRAFAANQEVRFLKSGVELEGSPLIVLQDTFNKGFNQSESIRINGANQAQGIRNSGRNALLSGTIGSVATLAKTSQQARAAEKKGVR